MNDVILDRITNENHLDWLNCHAPMVDRSASLRLTPMRGGEAIVIVDLANAFQAGKTCTEFKIERAGEILPLNLIFRLQTLRAVVDALADLSLDTSVGRFGERPVEIEGVTLTLYRGERRGIRVFSPLHLQRLKALPKAPGKWTITHVVRALANQQFENLRCRGQYSDDYAHDAAVNFGRGPIADHLAFARRLVESPTGWWTSEENGVVSICCHHFDSNSFRFVREAQARAA